MKWMKVNANAIKVLSLVVMDSWISLLLSFSLFYPPSWLVLTPPGTYNPMLQENSISVDTHSRQIHSGRPPRICVSRMLGLPLLDNTGHYIQDKWHLKSKLHITHCSNISWDNSHLRKTPTTELGIEPGIYWLVAMTLITRTSG